MAQPRSSIGRLADSAICDTLIDRTIEFIWSSLLPWKEDPSRPLLEAEDDLNAQLQNFLQSRANEEFPMILFQLQQRQRGRRTVDLAVKPIGSILIQGVEYTRYQPIVVVEGKRLPAPSNSREREYVIGNRGITGGIQRFKLGHHGGAHDVVIMIGYIQRLLPKEWRRRINSWILELAQTEPEAWLRSEVLTNFRSSTGDQRARSTSVHPRGKNCGSRPIRILHFWIQCSQSDAGRG